MRQHLPGPALLATLALSSAGTIAWSPNALAAIDGSAVVINEVYGGGGNSGALYSRDFVELYNPTEQDISLDGMEIEYLSAQGGSGGKVVLAGTLPSKKHHVIGLAEGRNKDLPSLPRVDTEGHINVSSTQGRVILTEDGKPIDQLSWGNSIPTEGDPAAKTSNSTSIARLVEGQDTDSNAADFAVGKPTPMDAGAVDTVADAPSTTMTIAEIQGTGDASPFEGQIVATEGIVTAVYPEGGKNGFTLQTAGSGGEAKLPGAASDAVFVYLGAQSEFPSVGQGVRVSGKVAEYRGQTQIVASNTHFVEGLAEVHPTAIDELPEGDDAREPYEHMLLLPGTHTVTSNYNLNVFGEIGLNGGNEPLYQPTDVVLPGEEAVAMQAANDARMVLLDDGRTRRYSQGSNAEPGTPLPYIAVEGVPYQTLRTGDEVSFQHPVVLDYAFGAWRYQPTRPVTGHSAAADLPIAWRDSRPAELGAMDAVEGDYSIASFNVLNYFTSLGENESGCEGYTDMNGTPVTNRRCKARGAYTEQAFKDQQVKIVNAINTLDADVVGLSEIENTARITGNPADRDAALAHLVEVLNVAAGTERWAYVPSPSKVGSSEDVIRLAFIYNPQKLKPVGESRIFDDPAFTRTARQPLAQEFAALEGGQTFVAVNNHFKSKGSVVKGDDAQGDGQGNNPNVRNRQALALLRHLRAQDDWKDTPTFLLGDFNSYSREDSLRTIEAEGFTNVGTSHAGHEPTYQFDGQLGSLDHVFANGAASSLIRDARVWNINSDEPVAYQYSRRNYNVVDFFDDSPFASSDHDPIKVGFNLGAPAGPVEAHYEPTSSRSIGQVFSAAWQFVTRFWRG